MSVGEGHDDHLSIREKSVSRTVETTMRKISAILCGRTLLLGTWSLLSVLICANVYARPGACFDAVKLEPGFIAFNSNIHSELGAWYWRLFGLEIAKEFSLIERRSA